MQQRSDLLTVRRNAVDVRQSVRQSADETGGEAAAECDKAVRRCEAAKRALIAFYPALRRRAEIIQAVPSCGFLNAAYLCACVPEQGTVTARPVAAVIGVAPYACDSG